jgi:hypothetical protein
MWLVRNTDGVLLLYQNKPVRVKDGWAGGGLSFVVGDFPLEHVPSFAEQQQWKDAPLQIKFEMKKK